MGYMRIASCVFQTSYSPRFRMAKPNRTVSSSEQPGLQDPFWGIIDCRRIASIHMGLAGRVAHIEIDSNISHLPTQPQQQQQKPQQQQEGKQQHLQQKQQYWRRQQQQQQPQQHNNYSHKKGCSSKAWDRLGGWVSEGENLSPKL